MAEVIPFRGILYSGEKIDNLAKVITPPFDVITEEEREDYYGKDPYNIIRLVLGKTCHTDTADNNWHTRASGFYESWLSERILIQDDSPSFYLTSIEFLLDDRPVTRYGLIALVRLEPFDKGIILPHERTFSGVRSERLRLIKACRTNFSPIFSLYRDSNGILDTLVDAVADRPPEVYFTDDTRQRHRMWRIADRPLQQHVSASLREKRIYIADGHHRYETSLRYRDWLSHGDLGLPTDHPANYVMMSLSSMQDPGLAILPAHRMLKGIDAAALSSLVNRAGEYFEIQAIPFDGKDVAGALSELSRTLKRKASRNAIGLCKRDARKLYLLTLKPRVMKEKFGNALPSSMQDLDVVVLTRIIFMEILGFDQERLDNEKLIAYSSQAKSAVEAVISGDCDIAFLLNPTKIEQVRRIAEEGLIMPRKATYFYPKVITGLVLNSLG